MRWRVPHLSRRAKDGAFDSSSARGSPSMLPKIFPEDFRRATHSRSKPIRENQLDKVVNPVGIKSLIADSVLSVLLPGMVAPLRRGCPRLPVQHLRQFIFFSRVGRPSCTLLRILFC